MESSVNLHSLSTRTWRPIQVPEEPRATLRQLILKPRAAHKARTAAKSWSRASWVPRSTKKGSSRKSSRAL
eukprot:13020216-Alexandrium_andersonii.AAC.1